MPEGSDLSHGLTDRRRGSLDLLGRDAASSCARSSQVRRKPLASNSSFRSCRPSKRWVLPPPECPEDALDGQAAAVHSQGKVLPRIVDHPRLPHPLGGGPIILLAGELHEISPVRLPSAPTTASGRDRRLRGPARPGRFSILPQEPPASRSSDHPLGGAGRGGVELPRNAAGGRRPAGRPRRRAAWPRPCAAGPGAWRCRC